MRFLVALLSIALTALAGPPALALDYRSVSEPAILFDAPGGTGNKLGNKLYIIARGTPVEVVLTQDNWTKVRGGDGNMAWIESRLLSATRTLMVRADKAEVRAEANAGSALVFTADRNVLLDLLEAKPGNATPGWAKVRHRDAQGSELSGYVKASQVWGL